MARAKPEGRGRLSSIDLLPPEADAAIVWAHEELRARKLPGTAILAEFNKQLADLGLDPVSKGAWSRYSVRKAVQWRKDEERREVVGRLFAGIKKEEPDEVTLVVSEIIKLEVYEMLERGSLTVKDLNSLARTLRHTVGAQADTVAYRKALAEHEERLKRIAAAVNEAGARGVADKDTLARITELLTTGSG